LKESSCAVIIGGYVNGYSIIQELSENKVKNIILFDASRTMASYSNKIARFILTDLSCFSLQKELEILSREYDLIVLFPTDDKQLENLYSLSEKISAYCFIPFNKENFPECVDKYYQYTRCERLGVPCPKTIEIKHADDIADISTLTYPVIIKPKTRLDQKRKIFRNFQLQNEQELRENKDYLIGFIRQKIEFVASEIIPGDGSNIYAYVGYRDTSGRILNEWTGKKLSQFPDDFGVFSSASNMAPKEILQQGRTILNGMNLKGIAEPEFKYDPRDGKYKLMEINLRSMMWNRVGTLSAVKIHYTQYIDALGDTVPACNQEKSAVIHFVSLRHEILNVLSRKRYGRVFLHNLFAGDKTYFAFFDKHDLKPFLFDCLSLISCVALYCPKAVWHTINPSRKIRV
jgi:D-aspartate ligase